MGRKLRHVLIFLLIILKEPNMPEARCRSKCKPSSCICTSIGLTSIPQDLPTSISELSLKSNWIKYFDLSEVMRYRNLTKLSLDMNMIAGITPTTGTSLPKLTYLCLNSNKITYIQPGTFQSLPKLTELYINSNPITEIRTGTFLNLLMLTKLNLNSNQITNIKAGAFSNLPNLHYLYLGSNQITDIHPDIFLNVPNLQYVSLRSNHITDITPTAFSSVPNLDLLSLPFNQITELTPTTFSRIPKLGYVCIKSNQITVIKAGTFSSLPYLMYLYLESNQVTEIKAGTFSGTDLPRLSKLHLSSNQITDIKAGTFSNLPNLKRLYLDSNKITDIQSGAFSNLPKLKELVLTSNQISVLPQSAYDMLASISTQSIVNIEENPWQCDCRIAPLRLKMNGSCSFKNQIVCARPAMFFGKKLKDIAPKCLICEVSTQSILTLTADGQLATGYTHSGTTHRPVMFSGQMPKNITPTTFWFVKSVANWKVVTTLTIPSLPAGSKAHPVGPTFTTLSVNLSKQENYTTFTPSPVQSKLENNTTFAPPPAPTKPENNTALESDPNFSPLVNFASVCGSIAGIVLICATILAICYKLKRRARNPNVLNVRRLQVKGPTALQHNNFYMGVDTPPKTDQQGQFPITETNTNTTATVVTSGNDNQYENDDQHDPTYHDHQYENNDQHIQAGQGQYQPITAPKKNTTATAVTNDHDPEYEIMETQHDHTDQGKSQATTYYNESLGTRNVMYTTEKVATAPNPVYSMGK
ncbi:uncharacterized protein LOC144903816 [Branchiostoma floridae x Branchiostoma belcheri]